MSSAMQLAATLPRGPFTPVSFSREPFIGEGGSFNMPVNTPTSLPDRQASIVYNADPFSKLRTHRNNMLKRNKNETRYRAHLAEEVDSGHQYTLGFVISDVVSSTGAPGIRPAVFGNFANITEEEMGEIAYVGVHQTHAHDGQSGGLSGLVMQTSGVAAIHNNSDYTITPNTVITWGRPLVKERGDGTKVNKYEYSGIKPEYLLPSIVPLNEGMFPSVDGVMFALENVTNPGTNAMISDFPFPVQDLFASWKIGAALAELAKQKDGLKAVIEGSNDLFTDTFGIKTPINILEMKSVLSTIELDHEAADAAGDQGGGDAGNKGARPMEDASDAGDIVDVADDVNAREAKEPVDEKAAHATVRTEIEFLVQKVRLLALVARITGRQNNPVDVRFNGLNERTQGAFGYILWNDTLIQWAGEMLSRLENADRSNGVQLQQYARQGKDIFKNYHDQIKTFMRICWSDCERVIENTISEGIPLGKADYRRASQDLKEAVRTLGVNFNLDGYDADASKGMLLENLTLLETGISHGAQSQEMRTVKERNLDNQIFKFIEALLDAKKRNGELTATTWQYVMKYAMLGDLNLRPAQPAHASHHARHQDKDGLQNNEVIGVAGALCTMVAYRNYQAFFQNRTIGKALTGAGPGEILHVMLGRF